MKKKKIHRDFDFFSGNCGFDGACRFPHGLCAANGTMESQQSLLSERVVNADDSDDPQILRHLVLLILLLCSMFTVS